MMAKTPLKDMPGIENHWEEKPAKTKFKILKPGTTKVTKYKVIV